MPAAAPPREVYILKDNAAVAKSAAEEFVKMAQSAVTNHGSFSVALSGGSTPKLLYSLLATDPHLRARVPWDKMQLFFGDERHVGPDDEQSNFKMALETMITKAPLKPEQVHRMKGEYADTERAAKEYEQDLRAHFHVKDAELPRLDLLLAGMGDEGHTLSLFPGTKALHAQGRTVVRNWIGKLYTDRITITAAVANNAEMILFMVAGKEKALALKGVLEGPYEPEQLPAQLLQPTNGQLLWLVDEAAGSLLSNAIRE
ncbi:MAG: 6-phosphogluconolactonase [Acidobacteriaceae bacterium]|jgi:6-phosphogluconolactonase|nr:6-phosphogluconolactonase [Acidobacteriaceae bacterium]